MGPELRPGPGTCPGRAHRQILVWGMGKMVSSDFFFFLILEEFKSAFQTCVLSHSVVSDSLQPHGL